MRYQNILAPVDLQTEDLAPLRTGGMLAREQHANLLAMSVLPHSLSRGRGFFGAEIVNQDELLDAAREALLRRCQHVGASADDLVILRGDSEDQIPKWANRNGVDLIVVGTHGRAPSEYLFGTNATAVLANARCDVYSSRSRPRRDYAKAMVAIPGGSHRDWVLAGAREFLSTYPGVDVEVLNVVEKDAGESPVRVQETLRDAAWRFLSLPSAHRRASHTILQLVRDRAPDLLIMGSGSRSGIARHLGSTANNVLHDIETDVLVIRTP